MKFTKEELSLLHFACIFTQGCKHLNGYADWQLVGLQDRFLKEIKNGL